MIETGFVGVKYTFKTITEPHLTTELNFYNPLTTKIELVEVRPQTDLVKNVDCVTNEGLRLTFSQIDIGNILAVDSVLSTVSRFGTSYDTYLVTDLVRHQINVICSKKAAHEIAISEFDQLDDLLLTFIQSENDRQKSGLIINFVRLTKPKLPESIEKNYLALAEEKTLKKVLEEKRERIRTEKESEILIAQKNNEIKLQEASNNNEIKLRDAANENEMMILKMKARKEESFIQNEMIISAAKANAEKIILEAEALRSQYSIPGYTDVKIAEALSRNQKIFYGDKLPKYMMMPSSVMNQTCAF